jgi:hypothetical protein
MKLEEYARQNLLLLAFSLSIVVLRTWPNKLLLRLMCEEMDMCTFSTYMLSSMSMIGYCFRACHSTGLLQRRSGSLVSSGMLAKSHWLHEEE